MDTHLGNSTDVVVVCASLRQPVPNPKMNFQEKQPNQSNNVYCFQNPAKKIISFCGSTSEAASSRESTRGFGKWEAAVAGQLGVTGYDVKRYRDLIMDVATGVQNVSGEDITTLANAAPATMMMPRLDDGRVNSLSFSVPNFYSMSIPVTGDLLRGSSTWVPGKYTSDVSAIPYQHPYDPNIPFEITEEVSTLKNVVEFIPITPDKPITAKSKQSCNLHDLSQDQDKPEKSATTEVDPNGKDIVNSATDASNAALSTAVQDTENCDDGATPERKPRRRKHRPKVITESKARKTPKPVTPEPAGSKEKPTIRKYVRKKPLAKRPTTSPLTEEPVLKGHDYVEKSSKRRLNFDTEEETRDESSNVGGRTRSKPNVQLDGEEIEATVGNTQKGIANDLTADVNQELKDRVSLPEKQAPSTPLPMKPRPRQGGRRKAATKKDYTEAKDQQIADGQHGAVQSRLDMGRIQSESTVQLGEETEGMINDTQMSIAYDQSAAVNQQLKDYISSPNKQVPTTPLPTKPRANRGGRRKADSENGNVPSVPQSPPKDFNCSMGKMLIKEGRGQGKKRKSNDSTTMGQTKTDSSNISGYHYNAYQIQIVSWNPIICKKRRSEKGQASSSSNTYSSLITEKDTVSHVRSLKNDTKASKANNWAFPTHLGDFTAPATVEEGRGSLEAFIQTERLTKKRSRGPTRVRDLSSMSGFADCKMQQTLPGRQGPQQSDKQQSETHNVCVEALTAELHATLTKKKRTKKTNSLFNLAFSGTNKLPWHQRIVLHNNQFSVMGARPDDVWKQYSPIDEITERLKYLDIKRENKLFFDHEQNALVPYFVGDHDKKALVLYNRQDGTIVPFEGAFDPLKKRRPRPKVNLDDETNRVWKLLLANINSEGIDGTDEEKTKWWEEERSVFQGRADSFIARMRLVQGDRRFSPWKGSVLDSVVGVFLTQNVSDHLSSSAFMSLASHFPLKSSSINKELFEGTGSVVDEPVMTLLDSEDTTMNWKMFNQLFCDQGSMTAQDSEHNEEKEVVIISNESTKNINGIVSPIYESQNKQLSCSNKEINEAGTECSTEDSLKCHTFMELLQMAESTRPSGIFNNGTGNILRDGSLRNETEIDKLSNRKQDVENSDGHKSVLGITSFMNSSYRLHITPTSGVLEIDYSNTFEEIRSSDIEEVSATENSVITAESVGQNTYQNKLTVTVQEAPLSTESCINNVQQKERTDFQTGRSGDTSNLSGIIDITESNSVFNNQNNTKQKSMVSNLTECRSVNDQIKDMKAAAAKAKAKARRVGREINEDFDWDGLRRKAEANGKREKNKNTMDSLDWEAVRCADVDEIADTIKERGMNNVLAGRIKDFLNRLVREHGSSDLEWLRDIPPDQAKEFLLSIRGLGLKSVECVRLLTLHHLAFPVDTNVGRIAVRLGWVPLQPLPESLQLHLLELYPVLESIQRYLWPRLCKLDQKTLYELHYQLITFGKVFCTKSKPNCNACPMRGECRHFASAFASARLALPGPEKKGIMIANESSTAKQNSSPVVGEPPLSLTHVTQQLDGNQKPEANNQVEKFGGNSCEPIIEEPLSPEPEPEPEQLLENDIEDAFIEDPNEIPTINLNIEAFTKNLEKYMQQNMELQEGEMSRALVAITTEAASIPTPKLKNVSQLRTEHQVYELPDSHPLLKGLDKREADDPCSYLLAIWTPGETASSIEPPERKCSSQEEYGKLCDDQTCFACNSIKETNSQTVRGTLLIPCRTAMRGSFPLNGTYFQVNEVFADHDSSLEPIDVPRSWIWNLPRRTVYFGTSIPSIFKGLPTHAIQHCFWRGYVCVRGFDQKNRAPRPLMARLHFPASRLSKAKGKTVANDN